MIDNANQLLDLRFMILQMVHNNHSNPDDILNIAIRYEKFVTGNYGVPEPVVETKPVEEKSDEGSDGFIKAMEEEKVKEYPPGYNELAKRYDKPASDKAPYGITC
jgi:hypothetical protein